MTSIPDAMHIQVSRIFPHPLAAVFGWLTDYDEGDAERAGAVLVRRTVTKRGPARVEMDVTRKVLGRTDRAQCVVDLKPPAKYTARFNGGRTEGQMNEYRLRAIPGEGTRLTVDYTFPAASGGRSVGLRLARPLVRKSIERMWDGFERSMEHELGAPRSEPHV